MSSAARCIRFASFVLRFSLFFFPFPPRQTDEKPGSQAMARHVAKHKREHWRRNFLVSVSFQHTHASPFFVVVFLFGRAVCVWGGGSNARGYSEALKW